MPCPVCPVRSWELGVEEGSRRHDGDGCAAWLPVCQSCLGGMSSRTKYRMGSARFGHHVLISTTYLHASYIHAHPPSTPTPARILNSHDSRLTTLDSRLSIHDSRLTRPRDSRPTHLKFSMPGDIRCSIGGEFESTLSKQFTQRP